MEINSLHNPQIKNIIKLKKSSERKKQGVFVVEGEREISIALKSGLEIDNLYLCEEFNKNKEGLNNNNSINLSKEVFNKISHRESPDGYLATFKQVENNINKLVLKENPLIVILEAIEKPGNLGAIMRTADAAGVDAVVVNSPAIDIYNPNAIRASQGTIFSTPIYSLTINETVDFCKTNKIKIYATTPRANKNYFEKDYLKGAAVLMGAEDTGLSDKWLKLADYKIKIPMKGKIDSLNLSVSAAIIVYEIIRQRE